MSFIGEGAARGSLLAVAACGGCFWLGHHLGSAQATHACEQKLVDNNMGWWEVDIVEGDKRFRLFKLKPAGGE